MIVSIDAIKRIIDKLPKEKLIFRLVPMNQTSGRIVMFFDKFRDITKVYTMFIALGVPRKSINVQTKINKATKSKQYELEINNFKPIETDGEFFGKVVSILKI